jgi:hypothetical protein
VHTFEVLEAYQGEIWSTRVLQNINVRPWVSREK